MGTGAMKLTLEHGDGDTWVHSVAFSPDGQLVVTTAEDRAAKIWRVENGQLVHVLARHHRGSVVCATFSPDSQLVATASADHVAMLWSVETAEKRASLQTEDESLTSVSFSPDGQLLGAACFDGTAKLW